MVTDANAELLGGNCLLEGREVPVAGNGLAEHQRTSGGFQGKGLRGRVSHDTLALDAVITAFRTEKRVPRAPER